MFTLGFHRDPGYWNYMVDGESDPFYYWRKCSELQLAFGFFSVHLRRSEFILEDEPGELHPSKFRP